MESQVSLREQEIERNGLIIQLKEKKTTPSLSLDHTIFLHSFHAIAILHRIDALIFELCIKVPV